MRILIFAANGFIGRELCQYFHAQGQHVTAVSRKIIDLQCSNFILWNAQEIKQDCLDALEEADLIINLCGKSVNCRYNAKNKEDILKSRTETTQLIGQALSKCSVKERLWLNASTATIYQESFDHYNDDSTGQIGEGFSVEIAKAWEESFFKFKLPNCRQIALRSAIVIGKDCDFINITRSLIKKGLGGKQGNGKQFISWVHVHDLCEAIQVFIENKELDGPINIAAPEAIQNKDFMSLTRKTLKIKLALPAPKLLIQIGAFFIRTEAELPLKSRKVKASKLQELGFTYKYPDIQSCLKNVL